MWKERIVFYVKRKNSDFNLWTTSNYRTFFIDDKAQLEDKVVLLGKMSSGKKIDSESIIQISNLTVNFKIYLKKKNALLDLLSYKNWG